METDDGILSDQFLIRSPATIKEEDESGNEECLRSPDVVKQEGNDENGESLSNPLVIKQEVNADEEVSISVSLGDTKVKEETNIGDPSIGDGCIKNSGEFKLKEKVPLLLSLVDEEGNVLEEYIEENGRLTPVKTPDSSPPKKHKGRPRKKDSKKKLNARKKPQNGYKLRRDVLFQYESYSCKLCENVYKGRKAFKKHLNQHFTMNNNNHLCSLCGYMTESRGHINRHIMDSHDVIKDCGPTEKLFVCTLCEQSFRYEDDLRKHMFVHTRTGPLKCSICDFSHIKRKSLERHVMSHSGVLLPPEKKKYSGEEYECHDCGYKCECKSALRRHIERHLGLSRFKCDVCGYTCIFKGDLTKHVTIHSDKRPYSCSKCSKTFKRRSHLLSHFNSKASCQLEMKRSKKTAKGRNTTA